MKKIKLLIVVAILFTNYLLAQNVGIGTTTPSEKLEIKNGLRSTVKISSADYVDTTELLLSNRKTSNTGTDFSIKNIREEGLFFSSKSDLAVNNFANSLVIKPNGNVGIAVAAPAARFQVNHNSLINTGISLVDSGFVSAGVMQFKIAYLTSGMSISGFASSNYSLHKSLSIKSDSMTVLTVGGQGYVGIRDFSPNYPLDINGDINTTGRLLINGNSGTGGQVLTSNGTGDPTWQNTALSNSTRFSVNYTIPGFSTASANVTFSTPVRYNLDPANISIAATSITLTKAGLYHFELYVKAQCGYSAFPLNVPSMIASILVPGSYELINKPFPKRSNDASYGDDNFFFNELVSFDIYVNAGSVIRVNTNINDPSTAINSGYFTSGHFSGHFISE